MQPIYVLNRKYFSSDSFFYGTARQVLNQGITEYPAHLEVREPNNCKSILWNDPQKIYEFCLSNKWVKENRDNFRIYSNKISRNFREFVSTLFLENYNGDKKDTKMYSAPDQIISLEKVSLEALEKAVLIDYGKHQEEEREIIALMLMKGLKVDGI